VDPGELVTATLKREFAEEALNSLEADEKNKNALLKKVDKFFEDGSEVNQLVKMLSIISCSFYCYYAG